MDNGDFKLLGVIILIALVTIGGLSLWVNAWNKGQIKKACSTFAQESKRETKYVEYSYWYVDCLTPQENGWVSTFNLRGE